MGREDQVEEREVLDSIFPDEITGTALWSYVKYLRFRSPADLIQQMSPKPHIEYQ